MHMAWQAIVCKGELTYKHRPPSERWPALATSSPGVQKRVMQSIPLAA